MDQDPEFDQLLAKAVAAPFSGWDFSWLEGRRIEEVEVVWDYEERARQLVRSVASLLDLGTGGGERLSQGIRKELRIHSCGWRGRDRHKPSLQTSQTLQVSFNLSHGLLR